MIAWSGGNRTEQGETGRRSAKFWHTARCAVAAWRGHHSAERGATEALHGARWRAPYPLVQQRKGPALAGYFPRPTSPATEPGAGTWPGICSAALCAASGRLRGRPGKCGHTRSHCETKFATKSEPFLTHWDLRSTYVDFYNGKEMCGIGRRMGSITAR